MLSCTPQYCGDTSCPSSTLSHKFVQNNDPKHTSRVTRRFLEANNINWCETPPESPNLNPIENMWYDLKKYLHATVQPRTQRELIVGIQSYWGTVTPTKCVYYITHLRKVIPKIIELEGASTGY